MKRGFKYVQVNCNFFTIFLLIVATCFNILAVMFFPGWQVQRPSKTHRWGPKFWGWGDCGAWMKLWRSWIPNFEHCHETSQNMAWPTRKPAKYHRYESLACVHQTKWSLVLATCLVSRRVESSWLKLQSTVSASFCSSNICSAQKMWQLAADVQRTSER